MITTRRSFLRALLGSAAGVALAPVVEPVERVRRFWQVPRAATGLSSYDRWADLELRVAAEVGLSEHTVGYAIDFAFPDYAEPVRLIGEHGATLRSGRAFELQLGNEPPRTLAGRLEAIEEMDRAGLFADEGDKLRAMLAGPEPLSTDEARRTLANADALFGIEAGSFDDWKAGTYGPPLTRAKLEEAIARWTHVAR